MLTTKTPTPSSADVRNPSERLISMRDAHPPSVMIREKNKSIDIDRIAVSMPVSINFDATERAQR